MSLVWVEYMAYGEVKYSVYEIDKVRNPYIAACGSNCK